jgi:hypothetical protein
LLNHFRKLDEVIKIIITCNQLITLHNIVPFFKTHVSIFSQFPIIYYIAKYMIAVYIILNDGLLLLLLKRISKSSYALKIYFRSTIDNTFNISMQGHEKISYPFKQRIHNKYIFTLKIRSYEIVSFKCIVNEHTSYFSVHQSVDYTL